MTLKDSWPPSMLRELSTEECIELLAVEPVGRVAYSTPSGPVVIPVNHIVDHGDIVFRTSPHTPLARAMAVGTVAFEVDGYDAFHQSGWSVLVHGEASFDPSPPDPEPVPWAEGQRHLTVRIRPGLITGRRLIG
jgi:nitroimidazol reductase NimA-like FMN-containing flavoprotein (pyridoxamine 5'-phosphate oxidase superfamily)